MKGTPIFHLRAGPHFSEGYPHLESPGRTWDWRAVRSGSVQNPQEIRSLENPFAASGRPSAGTAGHPVPLSAWSVACNSLRAHSVTKSMRRPSRNRVVWPSIGRTLQRSMPRKVDPMFVTMPWSFLVDVHGLTTTGDFLVNGIARSNETAAL